MHKVQCFREIGTVILSHSYIFGNEMQKTLETHKRDICRHVKEAARIYSKSDNYSHWHAVLTVQTTLTAIEFHFGCIWHNINKSYRLQSI